MSFEPITCGCVIRRKVPATPGVTWFDELIIEKCPLHEHAEAMLILLKSPLINGNLTELTEWTMCRGFVLNAIEGNSNNKIAENIKKNKGGE